MNAIEAVEELSFTTLDGIPVTLARSVVVESVAAVEIATGTLVEA